MKRRCQNPNDKHYTDYGGRGIAVCQEWKHDFSAFYADMGPRPTSRHTLERKDNDGDYTARNCTWATLDEQAQNRRSTKLTKGAVQEIIALGKIGAAHDKIAAQFSISRSHVGNIIEGRRWAGRKRKMSGELVRREP